ncbi:hypothetical protein Tco_0077575 [Tanacetum coccineum]
MEGVNQRVTELATTVRQETEEFQVQFEDAQDDQAYLRARVNTLIKNRPYHRHTAMILDREAMYARIAWTSSEDRSEAIEAHVRTLEAQVATLIAQTSSLQTQLTIALGRIETLEARDPEPQDEPAEASSSTGISCYPVSFGSYRVLFVLSLKLSLFVGILSRLRQPATPVPTRPMTDVQIKALIDQGIVDALAERDAERSRNGDDSHESGTG